MAGVATFTAELARLRTRLAELEPGVFSADDCVTLADALFAVQRSCAAAATRLAARAGECGKHRDLGYADAGDWVAATAGTTAGAARAALKTVAAVEECADARAALVAGEISLPQAEEIARTEQEVPGSVGELLEVARRAGLGPVRDRARARRNGAIAPEALHVKQRAARRCWHGRTDLGNVVIHAELTPEIGVKLVNRLDRATDRRLRAANRSDAGEAREAHAADALVAMLDGTAPATSGGADIVFTVDWRSFLEGELVDGGHSHVVVGGPVPPSVVRAMAKDAFLKAVLHDGVDIHRVVHLGRRPPAEILTALRIGAPPSFEGAVCAEEACERRYHLEMHHVDPVANGGATTLDNLRFECPPHHRERTAADRRAGKLGPRGP